jgi:hypothetical protein
MRPEDPWEGPSAFLRSALTTLRRVLPERDDVVEPADDEVPRRVDRELHPVAGDIPDDDLDVVTDADAATDRDGEDEHRVT